jgi:hypothetical protein
MEPIIGLLLGIALGVAILALLGLVLRWLWNTTLPEVAGLRPITTVQAIKLIFLSAILFGGHRIVTVEPRIAMGPPTDVERVAAPAPAVLFLEGVPLP